MFELRAAELGVLGPIDRTLGKWTSKRSLVPVPPSRRRRLSPRRTCRTGEKLPRLLRAGPLTPDAAPNTPPSSRCSDVVSKYREASVIAQQAIDGVLTQVVAGKRAVDICALGDTLIESLVAPLYKSKKTLEKGVAFPTCVSVNHTVAHYTPLDSEDKVVLVDGDVVKMCVVRGRQRRRARGAGCSLPVAFCVCAHRPAPGNHTVQRPGRAH